MGQQRRSVKNAKLTSKFHLSYMGTQLVFTLTLIFAIWGLIMFRLFELARTGQQLPYQEIAAAATLGATVTAVLAGISLMFSAHRIAGVHIKLCHTFNRVEDGDLSTRLKFRTTDKLEEVEEAFNKMMTAVEADIGASS